MIFSVAFFVGGYGSFFRNNNFSVFESVFADEDEDDKEDEDEDEEDDEDEEENEDDEEENESETSNSDVIIKSEKTVTEEQTQTVLLKDSDRDGIDDTKDPHPYIAEIYVVIDENKNGIADEFENSLGGLMSNE